MNKLFTGILAIGLIFSPIASMAQDDPTPAPTDTPPPIGRIFPTYSDIGDTTGFPHLEGHSCNTGSGTSCVTNFTVPFTTSLGMGCVSSASGVSNTQLFNLENITLTVTSGTNVSIYSLCWGQ